MDDSIKVPKENIGIPGSMWEHVFLNYSGNTLAMTGKCEPPFYYEGRYWVNVRVGPGQIADCVEVVPPGEYNDPYPTYTGRVEWSHQAGYAGMTIRVNGRTWVFTTHAARFTPLEDPALFRVEQLALF